MASDHHLNQDGIKLILHCISVYFFGAFEYIRQKNKFLNLAIPPRSPFSTASCLSVFLVAKLTCQFEVRWGETDLWVLSVSCLFSEFYSSMVPFYSRYPNKCWITVLANISSSRSWPFAFTKKNSTHKCLTFHHLASERKTIPTFSPFSLQGAPSCIYEWKASLLSPCRRNPQSSVSAECPCSAVKVLYVYDVPTNLWVQNDFSR